MFTVNGYSDEFSPKVRPIEKFETLEDALAFVRSTPLMVVSVTDENDEEVSSISPNSDF